MIRHFRDFAVSDTDVQGGIPFLKDTNVTVTLALNVVNDWKSDFNAAGLLPRVTPEMVAKVRRHKAELADWNEGILEKIRDGDLT